MEASNAEAKRKERKVRIFRVEIVRENGDKDVLFLCGACAKTIADFATTTLRRPFGFGSCDRCGET